MIYWNLFLLVLLLVSLTFTVLALYFSHHERRAVIYAWRAWPYLAAILVISLTFLRNSELRLFGVISVAVLITIALIWVYWAYTASGARNFWRWQLPGRSLR